MLKRPGRIERPFCVNCAIGKVSLCHCCNELISYSPKCINEVKYCEKCFTYKMDLLDEKLKEMNPNKDED